MNNIKTNIKKAIKEYKKEYGQGLSLNSMWEDWYVISHLLEANNINVEFCQLDEGSGATTMCNYYIPALHYAVILDWDVSSQYENEDDLIDTIAEQEEKGRKIEQNFKDISKIKDDLTTLVKYSWENEEKHYQESEPTDRKTHIFSHVKRINKWLKQK